MMESTIQALRTKILQHYPNDLGFILSIIIFVNTLQLY